MNYFLSTASRAGLYFRTLRHLRVSQISGQVMARVRRQFLDPAKVLKDAPSGWEWPEQTQGSSDLGCVPPPAALQDPRFLAQGRFTFINQTAELGSPVDWSSPEMPRLWNYNLHYFDWIWSCFKNEKWGNEKVEKVGKSGRLEDGEVEKTRRLEDEKIGSCEDFKTAALQDFPTSRLQAIRLVEDWIDNHPPSRTAGGWEPYPTSLRLMNWALLFGVKGRDLLEDDLEFKFKLLESIARQVKWLEVNLETHIQANHLLENLVALVTVASVMAGPQSERVMAKYLPMLERELEEQFLADGLHYERSPMYHLRMMWLLQVLGSQEVLKSGCLEVLKSGSGEVGETGSLEVGKLLERGGVALAKLRHPDGGIALFNDAVTGVYPDHWQDVQPVNGAWSLPDSGYYGHRDTAGNYLTIDAGAVGPDYQPGHAHADYLSFELSLGGKRIITDSGIGTYDAGERRSYDRSTAAHSTVEIAGQNSAEVWGGFRVGRRVTPTVERWEGSGSAMELRASHDGYAHLPSKAEHSRSFKWADKVLLIEDTLDVISAELAVSRLHFSPDCAVHVISSELAEISIDGDMYCLNFEGADHVVVELKPSSTDIFKTVDRPVVVASKKLSAGKNIMRVRLSRKTN